MSDWVSIDRATIDTHGTYEVLWPDGSKDTRSGRTVCTQSAVAVRDVTPPKPKRASFFIPDNHSQSIHGPVQLREVMPGDCDPDVVREVVAEMRENAWNSVVVLGWADRLEGKQ